MVSYDTVTSFDCDGFLCYVYRVMIDISVVIPVYGCPEALEELHRRLVHTLQGMEVTYEIILVDDCCPYGSWKYIEQICSRDRNTIGIRFSRNFGQMRAISAGVNAARGEYIITMDCDLQDVPENIPSLYSKVREGYDVVFARRKMRKDPIITRLWAKLFHKLFSYLSEIDFDYDLATYLIASKRAADCYRETQDRGRDFGMYLMWTGYRHAFVEFEHGERYAGKSSYNFSAKFKYAISTMTTFSNRILYIPIYIGAISSIASVAYLIYVIYTTLVLKNNPEGWATIVASVFLFGGLILSVLGIFGLYIGNIYDITKSRPLYIVQETLNSEAEI